MAMVGGHGRSGMGGCDGWMWRWVEVVVNSAENNWVEKEREEE